MFLLCSSSEIMWNVCVCGELRSKDTQEPANSALFSSEGDVDDQMRALTSIWTLDPPHDNILDWSAAEP